MPEVQTHAGWQGCPLINPMMPSDLCGEPRGHDNNHHLMSLRDPLDDARNGLWHSRWYRPDLHAYEDVVREGQQVSGGIDPYSSPYAPG